MDHDHDFKLNGGTNAICAECGKTFSIFTWLEIEQTGIKRQEQRWLNKNKQ